MEKKIPVVYVQFLDHVSEAGWKDKDEIDKFNAAVCHQVGFLVSEDDKVYRVSGQVNDQGDCGDTMAILKSTVTKFKRLNVKL